jgi:excisionase family DNA binding protein
MGPDLVACLTVAEVAAALRVSRMTVYRLVHSGALGALRIGGGIRVPEAALMEYLAHAGLGGAKVCALMTNYFAGK